MAIITIPAIKASGQTLRLLRGDTVLETFSGGVFIVEPPNAVWMLSFPLVPKKLDVTATRLWHSALAQLSKQSNQFKATPPSWVNGQGYRGANPTVNGASQLGTSLNISGGTGTMALEGDYFEVNGEFKILTANAVAAGTLNFEPALRTSPSNGATVDVKTPKITLRLITPLAEWSAQLPDFFNMNIDAIEHF